MKIGIVGLGLIGGSLGLDLRSRGYCVLGVSRQASTCESAVELGAVDRASLDLSSLTEADLVFLCPHISAIPKVVAQLAAHLQPETILTDVGSVKGCVVRDVTPLWSNFVGGHPMAGDTQPGIAAARQHLFCNAPYVLTPTPETPAWATEQVAAIALELGARVYRCSPEEHDRAVAWISHLPVTVSSSLIAACLAESDPSVRDLAEKLASTGFRDTSRVGGGNPELGVMMAAHNRDSLLRSLRQYRATLDSAIDWIEREDWSAFQQRLQTTREARSRFLTPDSD